MVPPDDISTLIGLQVRFISGRYNGFEGLIHWAGNTCCSVVVRYENRPLEVVDDYGVITPLDEWKKERSAIELALKGSAPT